MKKQKIDYKLLTSSDKEDIKFLKKCHNIKEIKEFISLSKNYFNYVTSTDNVFYFKILLEDKIVGGMQIEIQNNIAYLDIWILPTYQHQGIAKQAIKDILNKKVLNKYNSIKVGIDIKNIKSLSLFKKLGFKELYTKDNISEFKYDL